MKKKELEAKIEQMEREIAELKARPPIVIVGTQPCGLQHYPSLPAYPAWPGQYPNTYPGYPSSPIWCGAGQPPMTLSLPVGLEYQLQNGNG